MIKDISVVIIASNASKTLKKTLESLKGFEEVVVYENNSTDNTKEIAKNFKNVKLIEGEFQGFGKTKNNAASFAKNEWIFSLDSDESITKELEEEISTLDLKDKNILYKLKRDNYFLEKRVRFSGWGKDYLVRIYNKSTHSFNDNPVHEFIKITSSSKVVQLKNSFKHEAITDINQFLYKIAKYSQLASEGKKTCWYIVVILKANFAFIKTYFFQLGFLDGWRGFFIAVSNYIGKFYRYTKRYINCKR